jgi:hypothetical protein
MKTRRNILKKGAATAATGATLLSGCTETTDEQETQENTLTIPYNGLGTYEKSLQEARPVTSARTKPGEHEVQRITTQETVEQEADELAKLLEDQGPGYDINSLMKGYHQQKEDPNNQIILNQNTLLPYDNKLHEIYTVKNGQLQNQPILQSNTHGIHKPGQQKPEPLKDLRQFAGTRRVPEQLKSTDLHLEAYTDNAEQEEMDMRENMNLWSECILGLYDSGVPLRPETYDDGMLVYEAKFGDEDPDIYAELCQAVDDEEVLDSDVVVEASYNGDSWEMAQNPDVDIGDFYEEGLVSHYN